LSYLKDIELISSRLDILRERLKEKEKKQRKTSREYQHQQENVASLLNEMEEIKKEISSNLELFLQGTDRQHINIWDRIDIRSSYEDFQIPDNFEHEILAIQRILTDISKKDESSGVLSEASVLNALIEFLQKYRSSEIVLPCVNKTIDEFLSVLEEHYRKYKAVKIRYDNIKDTLRKLDDLRELKRKLEREFARLKVLKESLEINGESSEIDNFVDQKEMDKLELKLNNLIENIDACKAKLINKGIKESEIEEYFGKLAASPDIKPYESFNDKQLMELIDELSCKNIAIGKSIASYESILKISLSELKRIEKLEPHKYEGKLDEIVEILNRIQRLENMIGNEFNQYIKSIMNKKPASTEAEKRYHREVSRYLAKKVGFIRHIEDEYKVKEIDLVAGNIITDSGKCIRLSDMGTGQSQAAYLLGLLSTDDTRTIIALFDEVAAMDESSMEPIYKKLRKLYKENKLLVGIVVQKGDKIKVISKV
jgi:exonuclease SbcC